MEYEMLKHTAERITMPEEMKYRIVKNCNTQLNKTMEEHTMKHMHTRPLFRKPAAVFAALAICLSLSVTTLAATGTLRGIFRDITDFRGSVVGTSYEQATDEICIDVTVNSNILTALATFSNPQISPFIYAEKLGIAAYQIVDANGNVVKEGSTESSEIVNGQAAIHIQLDGIGSGSYQLVVTAFVSEKKADQPLTITGSWECAFTN